MKRAGFTMIELIFVIVILGILAAVAVPKLVGVKAQAEEGNIKSFVGTLNRTVGPSKWSASLMDGANGLIANGTNGVSGDADDTDYDITATDTEMPAGLATIDVSTCVANGTATNANAAATTTTTPKYYIICRDGTDAQSPKFWYTETNPADTAADTSSASDGKLKL